MQPFHQTSNRTIRLSLVALLQLTTALGCASDTDKGTIVGNPPQGVKFDIRTSPDSPATAKMSSDLTLNSAWMSVERVRLRPAEDCSGDAEARLDGPLVADLLEAGVLPEPPELELNTNHFCRLEMTFSPVDLDDAPADTPADLVEHSLLIEGNLRSGTSFQIATDMRDTIRIEPTDGEDLVISEDADCLTVTPDISGWIDVAALEALDDGAMIYVNEDTNEPLLDQFEAAIEDGIELMESSSGSCSDGVTIGES